MYYEMHGTGEPLILLHGGVVGITMFGSNLAALSQKRKVIAVELQGHGHTADIDRPLTFAALNKLTLWAIRLAVELPCKPPYGIPNQYASSLSSRLPTSVTDGIQRSSA